MTKTKIGVEIHKTGRLNTELLQIVSAHNEGIIDMCAPYTVIGYITGIKGRWPDLHKGADLIMQDDNINIWHVTEDGGKTFTLTFEWKGVTNLDLPTFEEIQEESKYFAEHPEELIGTDDLKEVLQGPGE